MTHADLVTQIHITFGPVGRGKFIPEPLTTTTDEEEAERAIVAAAWPFIKSEDVGATFDWDAMTGNVIVGGFRPVGAFTMKHVSEQTWL